MSKDKIIEDLDPQAEEAAAEVVDEAVVDVAENVVDETFETEECINNEELLQAEVDKLKADMLRILADTENTKRRLYQEAEKNSKYAISSFAKALLPVADNMERAMANAEESSLLDGVKLTFQELLKVLNKFEITQMDCLDKPFNPNFHQVISEQEDNEKEAGTVISVLQTGYMIADRILREAMVIVSKP